MVVVLACGFAVPLGAGLAVEESRKLFDLRVKDTAELADAAEPALMSGDVVRIQRELAAFARECTCTTVVVDHGGRLAAASAPSPRDYTAAALAAMAGQPPGLSHVAWPWDGRPYVLGSAIWRDGRLMGAAVTITPTGDLRTAIALRLLALAAVVATVVLAAVLFAVRPLVRWVLNPVHLIDDATEQVGSGIGAVHVPETMGPPEMCRLARGFNDMAGRVLDLATRQRDFVAQASHQLRNPLTALRLRVENAFELGCEPRQSEDLKLALSEVDRLCAIVDSLLLLAKSEDSDSLPVVVDVSTVATQRVDAWRPAYDRNAVPLITSIPEGVTALCLPELIEHGLDALLDNALKFGRKAPVRVGVQRRGDAVDIVVRDLGSGLPSDDLAFVGTRFWRSNRHQNIPGTGLGLAIVRRLAKDSGGEVTIAACRPHGLEVRVRVPSAPPRMGRPDGDALR